jgi:GT2 family glycosyltransferase
MSISIILTIFNKENIIKKIVTALFEQSSSCVNEYIFVFDGCKDRSHAIVTEELAFTKCKYKILYANDVFEMKANNIGLRECSNPYAIIIQDDMVVMEKNWDERLLSPILLYKDIWAVTARTSCSLNSETGVWYNIQEGPVGHRYNKISSYPRNKLFVGQVVNRGPLLVRMDILKDIGYFDETLPGCIGCDDVDACLRVFQKYGLRCASFYVSYFSPLEWGSTHTGPNTKFCRDQEILNKNEVIKRYKHILDTWNYDEVRDI